MTQIELKTTAIQDVRELCIGNNWYTCGNNQEYDNMFKLVTQGDLMDIADDIYSHSERKYCPCVGAAYRELEKLYEQKWKIQMAPDAE